MKIAVATVAYREARFMPKWLKHIPEWVDDVVVLCSTKPWYGEEVPDDGTKEIAESLGADVIAYDWKTEEDQRNAAQEYLSDCDWIVWLDPDEFLTTDAWNCIRQIRSNERAFIVAGQYTYWKNGYIADPPIDYQQLVMVKPEVRFIDKRVVNCSYGTLPIWIHHFSWARTDAEVWNKISHYAHAQDFDTQKWYDEVWLAWRPGMKDVHPTTPATLHELIPAHVPHELEVLELWP